MQISASIQRKLKVVAAVAGGLIASATPALADSINIQPSTPGFFKGPQELVNQLLKIIMVIGVILVFAYLVLGGIEYITSGGEKGKTEAARNKITAAVIGLIILASSYAILTLVLNFIGVNGGPSSVLNF